MGGAVTVRRKVHVKSLRVHPPKDAGASKAWALGGAALGVLAGMVFFAPAAWLAYSVDAATQGRVQLRNPAGTVWSGSAALELTGGEGGTSSLSLPSRIHWQLSPGWGHVQAKIAVSCCTAQPVVAYVGIRTLQLQAGSLQLPMAWLQGLGAPWNTLRLQGELRAHWEPLQLAWSDPLYSLQGVVNVQASQVSTSLTTLPQIGTYQLQLSGGSTPQLKLSTVEGALSLSGQGQWLAQRWRFEGLAQAHPAQAMELANLLTLLGRRQGNTTMIRWG